MHSPSTYSIFASLLAGLYFWRLNRLHQPSTWQHRIFKPPSRCLHNDYSGLHIVYALIGLLYNNRLRAIQSLANCNHDAFVFNFDSMDHAAIRNTQSMGNSSRCRIRYNALYRNVFYSHVERSAVLSRHCRHYRASVRSCCNQGSHRQNKQGVDSPICI